MIDQGKIPRNPKVGTPILGVLLFVSFAAAYFPVWKGLVLAWSKSADYSHGFFIIPICIYIIWRKKDIFAKISPVPSSWGLVLVVASLLTYVFARYAGIQTLASLSMIPLLAGVVLYLWGFRLFKQALFPLFLLLFMIPIPSQIYSLLTLHLQLLVTKVSFFIAAYLGVPVFREGNIIHLPDRTLQVVRACSGMRSLISLLTLSAVFGYFTLQSNFMKAVLFLSGVPIALAVNIIRVLSILLFFHYLNYDLTRGMAHTMLGLLVFALALGALALVKGLFSPWDRSLVRD